MDADETGNHGVSGAIDLAGAFGDLHLTVRADALDAAVRDNDRLAAPGGRPGPVHHLDTRNGDHRVAVLDELPGVLLEFLG